MQVIRRVALPPFFAGPPGAAGRARGSAGDFGAGEGELAAALVVALSVEERQRAAQRDVGKIAVFRANVEGSLEFRAQADAARDLLGEGEAHGERGLVLGRGA